MARWQLLVVVLAGCGRLSFDATGGDAGNTDDGAMDDAADSGSTVQRCDWITAYSDDFDDDVLDSKWAASAGGGTQIQENGGRLNMILAQSTGSEYAVVNAATAQDMRGRCVFITLVSAPTQTAVTDTFLGVGPFGSLDHAGFNVHNGRLEVYKRDSAAYTSIKSVAFDPVAHAILQLREEGGQMVWETSPTATLTFTEQHRGTLPFSLQSIRLTLQAGTYGSVASPGQAVFDNLNQP